jgi:hypothetical protein
MIRCSFILLFLISSFVLRAQVFGLSDLNGFTALNAQKFDAFILKKDYRRNYFSSKETNTVTNYIFQSKKKKYKGDYRNIAHAIDGPTTSILYQTSSIAEKNSLLEQIKRSGYKIYSGIDPTTTAKNFFQKGIYTVTTETEEVDSITVYSFIVQRKNIPNRKDIYYAEDLMSLTSHEYLVTVFGNSNVKQDLFYYSEKETNKCSILFPNSPNEVIFVWNDEANYSNLGFLLIGGNAPTETSLNFNQQIKHNTWRSKQGIFSGMNLKELHELNGKDINFYSWHMEQAGMLTKENNGAIDFNNLQLVLNCLNCSHSQAAKQVVTSSDELRADKKIYVSSIVVIPPREEPPTVLRFRR